MKRHILLADGDAQFQDQCQRFLEGYGYCVDGASSGLECYMQMMDAPPDVLVMADDLLWGGAEGVLFKLENDPSLAAIPVILMTRKASPTREASSDNGPVDKRLQKPLQMSDLLLAVTQTDTGDRLTTV